jgi:hypothetical protein
VAAEPAATLSATDGAGGSAPADVVTVFGVLWALAALFHVLGPSARAGDIVHDVTLVGASHLLVGLAALAVLSAPRSMGPLLGLAVVSPISAWLEAPVLGNHWLVVAFVDLALVGAAVSARRGWSIDPARFAALFLPLARWTLIAFYSFAAFSKLNHGFFDTAAGCGTFYFDELAGSLGFSTPLAVGHGGWAHLVPVGVAGIELAVPVLLVWRRTRNIGVVVGLVFHGIVALDQTHLFSDFSSVLLALFVLFLPASWAVGVVDRCRRQARLGSGLQAVALCAFAVTLVLLGSSRGARVFSDLLMWEWFVVDALAVVLVVAFVVRGRAERLEHPMRLVGVPRWLWLVPVVVVFNGLTPYLELKTAYGFNMYSNLVTADGETNHFLVPRTLPVNGNAADVVRIERTSDPGLNLYVSRGYDLPYLSLRAYLANHPTASIRYVRNGVVHDLAHASDEPDLVRPVSQLERKLLALRAVDQQDPPRCQDSFLPAL